MNRKERSRLETLSRVKDGQLTLARAAELLGLSRRQAYRLRDRYDAEGDGGLVHRLRGRPGNRKSDDAARRAAVELYRTRYCGRSPPGPRTTPAAARGPPPTARRPPPEHVERRVQRLAPVEPGEGPVGRVVDHDHQHATLAAPLEPVVLVDVHRR